MLMGDVTGLDERNEYTLSKVGDPEGSEATSGRVLVLALESPPPSLFLLLAPPHLE